MVVATKKIVNKGNSTKSVMVQFWHGENQSLLSLEVARWLEAFKIKHPQATLTRLEYKAAEINSLTQALHNAAFGGGMFVENKLVILTDFLKCDPKSDLAAEIKKISQEPLPGLFLLLVETSKVAWSKPLPNFFKKLAEDDKLTVREFVNLSPFELEKWIEARVKQEGGKLAPGVARLLAALVENNFFKLAQEISKLVAYRYGAEIKAADLDLLVQSNPQDDVFVFIESIGKRDFVAAQKALNQQFRQGTSPQNLVGLLAWHLRVLASVREGLDKATQKLSNRELAEKLSLHPFVVSRALQQIPYYSAEKIAWLYNELSDLDVKLKTSRVEPEVLFGLFLSKLATLSVARVN